MTKITYVKYVCADCGAEDSDKLLGDQTPHPAINCWKCRAGRDYPNAHEQINAGVGMILVQEDAKRAA